MHDGLTHRQGFIWCLTQIKSNMPVRRLTFRSTGQQAVSWQHKNEALLCRHVECGVCVFSIVKKKTKKQIWRTVIDDRWVMSAHTDRSTIKPPLIVLQCFWVRRKNKRKSVKNKVTSHAAKYPFSEFKECSTDRAAFKRNVFKNQAVFYYYFFFSIRLSFAYSFIVPFFFF